MSLLLPLRGPMGSTANGPSSASASGSGSGFLRDLLATPLAFGEPVGRASFAPQTGLREVFPGPPSPPRTLLRLEPVRQNGANGASGASTPTGEDEAGEEESKGENTPRKGKMANGEEPRRVKAGPSTPPHLRRKASPSVSPSPTAPTLPAAPALPTPTQSTSASTSATPTKKANGTGAPAQPPTPAVASSLTDGKSLHDPISDEALHYPSELAGLKRAGAGLYNPSMACYANATLQVMMHTPPFVREALAHDSETCIKATRTKSRFCLLCIMQDMIKEHWSKKMYQPKLVHNNLFLIKKGFSKTRQEDTHEFFRFACDALQNSALAGFPKDTPEKVKHTTWVHRIWGGRVRSRVVCSKCSKPSDTFDHFLDLSLDCGPSKRTLTAMLAGFVKEDKLEGDNKYHCESCKAKANATKSFRIAEAPPVLTLHLKRFSMNYNSWNGKARADKYNQHIGFDEFLDIAPYMVDPKAGGTSTKYRLFGVTCHRGADLRYGHYTAYVRAPNGNWYQADDEDMSGVRLGDIKSDKTAYLLSYIRIPEGEEFQAPPPRANGNGTPAANGHAQVNGNGGKRKRVDEAEEEDAMRQPVKAKGPMAAVKELQARRNGNGNGSPMTPRSVAQNVKQLNTATPHFSSRFDNRSDGQSQAPLSPPRSYKTADDDDEREGPNPMDKFGAALSTPASRIRTPISEALFYGTPPIRGRPGPSSPRGSGGRGKRGRNYGGGGGGGGQRPSGNYSPYAAGRGGMTNKFGGKKKGTLGNMKGRI